MTAAEQNLEWNSLGKKSPLIVGEVLFDCFSDGRKILGGAPFNVAWDLQGLGAAPLLISSVGDDDEGTQVRQAMVEWGMKTRTLQISSRLPTGRVEVQVDDGQPTFEILDERAFDDIQPPNLAAFGEAFSLLYVGSLAFRHEPSRSTIRYLIRESGLPRFVDINIREPWFSREWMSDLLSDACWVKLNDHELAWLADRSIHSDNDIRQAVDRLRRLFHIRQFFITCGERGAYAVSESGEVTYQPAPKPAILVDTVGAGDAFAAATILRLHAGLSGPAADVPSVQADEMISETLKMAVAFASHTCTIKGATTTDLGHYAPYRQNQASTLSTLRIEVRGTS